MSQVTVSEVKDLMKKKNVKDEPGMTLKTACSSSAERSDPQAAKRDQKATRHGESGQTLSSWDHVKISRKQQLHDLFRLQ